MKKIDAHAHIGYFGSFFDVEITTEQLIEHMAEYEIERTVICALENEKANFARSKYPERLLPIAWVNPLKPRAAEETEHYLKEGFFGVKLHPLMDAYVADDEVVDPVMEVAGKWNRPVFVHSGHPPFSLPWSISNLAARFPDVDTVMIHMGHGHGVYIQAAIEEAKKNENIYLESSGMPMHTKIKEAYETVGSDKIMFGTDVPFHHPSVEIQKIKVSGLTDKELEKVFYKNVVNLLDI